MTLVKVSILAALRCAFVSSVGEDEGTMLQVQRRSTVDDESCASGNCHPTVKASASFEPSIIFSTGQVKKKPSDANFENAVNSAVKLAVNSEKYCSSENLPSLMGYSNQKTCGGPKRDVAFKIEVNFHVDEPGEWEFDFNVDFGWGGVVTFDGERSAEGYQGGDHWWSRNLFRPLPLDIKHRFDTGIHQMMVYGAEGCCDGKSNIRFKKPDDTEWRDLTTENLKDSTVKAPTPHDYASFKPSIIFSTGEVKNQPSDANFENAVNKAVKKAVNKAEYCSSKNLPSLMNYNSQGTCGGPKEKVAFKIEVNFLVDEPGEWEFDFNVDFGWGGVVTFDGERSAEGYHSGNHWWSHDLNKAIDLDLTHRFDKGIHQMVVFGAEGCCDGKSNIRFKKPDDTEWRDLTTENLQASPPPTTPNPIVMR